MEILALSVTRALGIVRGKPVRREKVNKIRIDVDVYDADVRVREYAYRYWLVRDLAKLYGVLYGGPTDIESLLSDGVLELLWFDDEDMPLLGFEVYQPEDVFVVISPMKEADISGR